MNINALSSAQNSQSTTGLGRAAMDTFQFLKLLVTELTTQNPLDPLKDRDFMAQLAQLNTSQNVEQLSQVMTAMQAASLVGKNVEGVLPESGSRIEGKVEWVEFSGGKAQLRIGEQLLPFEAIKKIR